MIGCVICFKFDQFTHSCKERLIRYIFSNLAIGIGIQNFPEGLAVSLPLRGSGMSVFKSFW